MTLCECGISHEHHAGIWCPEQEKPKRPRRAGMTPAELTAWRTDRGWNMPLTARMLGVSKSTVSRWESGSRTIPEWVPKLLPTLE